MEGYGVRWKRMSEIELADVNVDYYEYHCGEDERIGNRTLGKLE